VISVLIVDDSATARVALRQAIESDPQLQVVGEAATGDEALRLVKRRNPDIVTMDVFLHRENGLDVAGAIMAQLPRPILVVTGGDVTDPTLAFRAIEVGALEICRKLGSPRSPDYPQQRDKLVRLVKTLAMVPVVSRHRRAKPPQEREPERAPARISEHRKARPLPQPQLLVIGASTGGPPVLSSILAQLPRPFPLPIAVVQHMEGSFVNGFTLWLAGVTGHDVVCVEDWAALEPGTVYLPRAQRHLQCTSAKRVIASEEAPRGFHRPSVDVLFESAARHIGCGVVAVLLTGMGRDGAAGLKQLHDSGALTIAQEPLSCAVGSMPSHAIELGAASVVLNPDKIAPKITESTIRQPGNRITNSH
jgi:two-component system chemotaxis response regulator CheB